MSSLMTTAKSILLIESVSSVSGLFMCFFAEERPLMKATERVAAFEARARVLAKPKQTGADLLA